MRVGRPALPKRPKPTAIETVHAAVGEAMHVPDFGYFLLVLGTIAANRIVGDTVSYFLSAPRRAEVREDSGLLGPARILGRLDRSPSRGCSQWRRRRGVLVAPGACSKR